MNTLRGTMLLFQCVSAITLLSAMPSRIHAAQITADTLATNCQELIAIYDNKGDRRFIAGMSTSVAEAMRAGICRGMIEEHTNHRRCNRSWYAMASIIIAEADSFSDIEDMLESACGR